MSNLKEDSCIKIHEGKPFKEAKGAQI